MTTARHKAFGDGVRDAVRKTPLAESSGAAGGYLVPSEVALAVDDRLRECGVFHRFARRQPMASRTCAVPAFDVTAGHAAGVSPLFGGMAFTWTPEGVTFTESEPSFSAAELVARDLTGLLYASNQLVRDGGEALGAFLEWQLGAAVEWFVEKECFSGILPGRPVGIVNSPSTVAVTRAGSSHVAAADIAGMAKALLPACYGGAIWAFNPSVLPDLATLATFRLNGQPSGTEIGTTLCGYLMGRPAFCTEKLPALGTRGDVVLFDPRLYVLGTRSLEIAAAPEEPTAFQRNQTAFRVVWRGDGQPIARGTATLADGGTTSGAFVALN